MPLLVLPYNEYFIKSSCFLESGNSDCSPVYLICRFRRNQILLQVKSR